MREFLSDNDVPFDDRNIRKSEHARAELEQRAGALVVPQLFFGDHHIVGFDPAALRRVVNEYRAAVA